MMDNVERVARALYDLHDGEAFDTAEPTYDELDGQIKGWYTEQAETAIAASGVAELVEALEPVGRMEMWTERAEDDEIVIMSVGTVRKMRTALARYRGEA
jgi:hypothetical protein